MPWWRTCFATSSASGVDPGLVAKKRGGNGPWTEIDEKAYPAFIDENEGCVIGGTAWDFANTNRVPPGSLDLLVIEEAGQFCLANTIAVAQAATNLLLLGDPQQLPQVSQGTHPEPVDASALGWLVDGRHTLPDELGYFLDRSYRMHPALCAAVSRLSYDGRLHSVEQTTAARRLDGFEPGVHVLALDHDGNSTDSREEAEAIVAAITARLGSAWTDEHGTRPLTASDVLVVTPYNAQVVLLRRLLDDGRAARGAGRYGRQVPGQAGAGGVHLDGGLLDRRGAARNLVPAQPESAQRGGEPGQVRRGDRPLGDADRVPALDTGGVGGVGCVPGHV